MTKKLDIKFSSLTYKCEKPSSNVRSKNLFPILKFGRMVEEYADMGRPAIRNFNEDLARVTSYFYFDHNDNFIQFSKCLKHVLSYSLTKNKKPRASRKVDIEQHCFEQLVERKLSISSVITAIKYGKSVTQYCQSKNGAVHKNISFFYEDLRVVVSDYVESYRVKTAYRLTNINDKNLLAKLRDYQRKEKDNPHDYMVVDLDELYDSSLMINRKPSDSKTKLYEPAWELLGHTFGTYQSLLSKNNNSVRNNHSFDRNKQVVDKAVVSSSLKEYSDKVFKQSDYDPKREYGLMFIYEKDSFRALVKRVYGIGLSAKIAYNENKVDPITNNEVLMIGISLTETSGHEWVKSSNHKELITIDDSFINNVNNEV